jgi:hypothetical protein
MASTEERMKILKMIEEGKISAEDGAKLLAALSSDRKNPPPPRGFAPNTPGVSGNGGRYFRIRVSDAATGKSKVNVNIPMNLVNVGLRMGARFAPELGGLDMSELQNAINAGMTGKIIDVTDDEDGDHVEIFVE